MYRPHRTTRHALARLLIFMAAMLAFSATVAGAQEDTVSFANGNTIGDMELQGDYVWCATDGSLVRWNKNDGTCRQFVDSGGFLAYGVSDMEIDSKGVFWIGTYRGLLRFENETFTIFTTTTSGLPDNEVLSLAAANNGDLWVGTSEGATRFDGKTWTNYTTANSGIASNYVNSIAVDKTGVVWFAHRDYLKPMGVSSFDGSAWKTYIPTSGATQYSAVNVIEVDSNNNKWFGTDLKLFRFDGTTWSDFPVQYVNDITADNAGKLWAAAGIFPSMAFLPVKSFSSFDGTTWTPLDLESKLERPIIAYKRVRIDTDGTFWIVTQDGSTGGAFSLHSYNGATVKTYRTDGPLSFYFTGIAVDNADTKWISTGHGIASYNGTSWTNHLFTLSQNDVSPTANLENLNYGVNQFASIAVDHDNTVWASSNGGDFIYSYNGTSWNLISHVTDASYLPIAARTILVDRDNVKWFVGYGVNRYDGKTWTPYKRFKMQATSGAIDNDNVKWFGTSTEGVWSFDGTTWVNYNKDNSPLKGTKPSNTGGFNWTSVGIYAAADHNNLKWFVDVDKMVYSFDGTNWKSYGYEVTGLSSGGYPVENLYVDANNTLWITERGLISFDGTTWKTWPGIMTGYATAISVDKKGYMWIASRYGVGESGSLTAMKVSNGPVAVAETSALPKALVFTGNYPNPFNPSTTLSFVLPSSGKASLTVYDITGRKVREIAAGTMTAGAHSAVWNGRDASGRAVSSGVYFARLSLGGTAVTHRMTLMK